METPWRMRARQPNLREEWEQVPAADSGVGGTSPLMAGGWLMRLHHDHSKCFLDLKSKSVHTKTHVQHTQNKMKAISLTSEILGNYAKILKYFRYVHGHSLIAVLSQI